MHVELESVGTAIVHPGVVAEQPGPRIRHQAESYRWILNVRTELRTTEIDIYAFNSEWDHPV